MTLGDRTIGILVGVVIGLAVIVLFVFVWSEDTVDAPSISNGGPASTTPADQTGTVPEPAP